MECCMGQSIQKSGLSKFCGRQPLKILKGSGYSVNINAVYI